MTPDWQSRAQTVFASFFTDGAVMPPKAQEQSVGGTWELFWMAHRDPLYNG